MYHLVKKTRRSLNRSWMSSSTSKIKIISVFDNNSRVPHCYCLFILLSSKEKVLETTLVRPRGGYLESLKGFLLGKSYKIG